MVQQDDVALSVRQCRESFGQPFTLYADVVAGNIKDKLLCRVLVQNKKPLQFLCCQLGKRCFLFTTPPDVFVVVTGFVFKNLLQKLSKACCLCSSWEVDFTFSPPFASVKVGGVISPLITTTTAAWPNAKNVVIIFYSNKKNDKNARLSITQSGAK